MNKNTLIGLGIGAVALAAGWHFYGRRWMQVARGNAATVRQQAKAIAPASTLATLRRPAEIASVRGSQAMQAAPDIKGALSGSGGEGADGFMLRSGVNS